MTKRKLRILPIFIFIAVLTLSLRISSVISNINSTENTIISFETTSAHAEDSSKTETTDLTAVLNKNSETENKADNSTTFTQSEIEILQELAKRREALDLRDKEIDKKAAQLEITEEEIQKKLSQLQEYEAKLRQLMQDYNQKEKSKLTSLVKLYTTMKTKDAARIMATLDIELATALLKEMKPSTSSAILSQMDAAKAKAITNQLIGNSLSNIEK